MHLIKPFGFELTDKRLKRAGLDYWKHISLHIYENIEEFYSLNKGAKIICFSSHAKKNHWSINYVDNMFFVFGKESAGLSSKITTKNECYKIPLYSDKIRSLNLANAVSIVVYDGLRNVM